MTLPLFFFYVFSTIAVASALMVIAVAAILQLTGWGWHGGAV